MGISLSRKSRFVLLSAAITSSASIYTSRAQAPTPQSKKPAALSGPAAPAAPQSTHYPILLLAFGSAAGADPAWSIRIGQKGPERLDRPGYPPAMLDPVDVAREGANDAWRDQQLRSEPECL